MGTLEFSGLVGLIDSRQYSTTCAGSQQEFLKKVHPGFRGRVSRKVAKIAKGEILMKDWAGPGVSQGG